MKFLDNLQAVFASAKAVLHQQYVLRVQQANQAIALVEAGAKSAKDSIVNVVDRVLPKAQHAANKASAFLTTLPVVGVVFRVVPQAAVNVARTSAEFVKNTPEHLRTVKAAAMDLPAYVRALVTAGRAKASQVKADASVKASEYHHKAADKLHSACSTAEAALAHLHPTKLFSTASAAVKPVKDSVVANANYVASYLTKPKKK